jgi:K+-sensing histidine kinase KdpD
MSPTLRAERVMTWIDPAAPAGDVLKASAQLASALDATWYFVYVVPPSAPRTAEPVPFDDELELAASLGAEVVRIAADDCLTGLIAFARREGVTHAVFGREPGRQAQTADTVAAAEATAFRQLLCRRLAILAMVWLVIAISWLSRTALVAGLALFGAVAGWAIGFERRAARRLAASVATGPTAHSSGGRRSG